MLSRNLVSAATVNPRYRAGRYGSIRRQCEDGRESTAVRESGL